MSEIPPRRAPGSEYGNGRANWVEVRLRMPPEWRDFFADSARVHASSISDEIRYALGHWIDRAEREAEITNG